LRIRSRAAGPETSGPERKNATLQTNEDNRIGANLVREGKLTPAEVDEVLRAQAANGQLFGEIATSSGKTNDSAIASALSAQIDNRSLPAGDLRIDDQLVAAFDMNSGYVNDIRSIRSKILQHQEARATLDVRSCAVLGLDCEEEVAKLAGNLAIVMVRMGSPTLLVDAALHDPALHALFHVPNRVGFVNLRPNVDLDTVMTETSIAGLALITTGPTLPDTNQVLERQPILSLLDGWDLPSSQIIASIPLGAQTSLTTVADSLAGFDCVVMAMKRDQSRIDDVRKLIDGLDEKGIAIAGAILV
jgi:Mrp family chromosome partitioning ATPase